MRFRTLKEKNLTFWKGVGVKGQFIYKRYENRMAWNSQQQHFKVKDKEAMSSEF